MTLILGSHVQKLSIPLSSIKLWRKSTFTSDLKMSQCPLRPQGLVVVKILLLNHAWHIL